MLAAGTGSLLLGLVWGGRQYAWGSGHVVLALAAAVVLLVVFGVVERRAPEPILPFDVLRNPIVAGSVACMALVGMAMFGTISYVPLFVQGVIGTSATSSGVVLTPMILGAVCTSILTGQLVSRTGRYRWNAVLGPVVLTGGDAPALAHERLDHERRGGAQHGDRRHRDRLDDAGVRALGPERGAALADRLGDRAHAVRAADGRDARRHDHGRARQPRPAARAWPPGGEGAQVHRLPPALRSGLADAIHPAFLVAACIAAAVWVIAVLFVKEQTLRRSLDEVAAVDAAAGTPAGAALESPT